MFQEEFRKRYTTIPLAIYKAHCAQSEGGAVSHQHKEFEFLAVLEGEAELYIDAQLYKIKQGDVCIIPPYSIHRIKTDKNFVTTYYCICFDGSLLCDKTLVSSLEVGEIEGKRHIAAAEPYANQMFSCIENAFLACEQQTDGWEMASVGYLSLLFSLLKQHAPFSRTMQKKRKDDFAQRTLSFISEYFQQPISSRDVAAQLYVNVSYFCRVFKKTFGCNFAQYLTEYRLERAKWALLNTEKSITEIAFSYGFHDCSYFAKAFREEYGVSPRAYRNRQ